MTEEELRTLEHLLGKLCEDRDVSDYSKMQANETRSFIKAKIQVIQQKNGRGPLTITT